MSVKKGALALLVLGMGIIILISGFTSYKDYEEKSMARQLILRYYQSFQAGNDELVYELIHSESRKILGKENFLVWLKQLRAMMDIESFEIKDIGLKQKLRVGEKTISDGISIKVLEVNRDLYTSEILSSEAQYYLLQDTQGDYRIFFEPREVLHSIAQNHILIGAMYIDGVGKEKDLTQGMEHFQKALEMDPSLIDVHYSLGVAYLEKREWSQAIIEEETYIAGSQDDEGKGEAYNIIGFAYQRMGDEAKAREAFEQAIHFNP